MAMEARKPNARAAKKNDATTTDQMPADSALNRERSGKQTSQSQQKNPTQVATTSSGSCPFQAMREQSSSWKNKIPGLSLLDSAAPLRRTAEKVAQEFLVRAVRPAAHAASYVVASALKPIKLHAYRTRSLLLKRVILEATTPIDFALIWLNIQNETMSLHEKIYGGNFIFGKGVMIVDHADTLKHITQPMYKTSDFMGVHIVASSPDVFSSNCGILNQNPPMRGASRRYLDAEVFTPEIQQLDYAKVKNQTNAILEEWSADPDMLNTFKIRGTVTRAFLQLLAHKTISKQEADDCTFDYMRRFVEFSLLHRYFPTLTGLLGSAERIRKDVYVKLRKHNINNFTIDVTLFAAMFSVGTLIIRCIENVKRYGISYADLSASERRRFIMESLRLYPTVTSVHRTLEAPETIRIAGEDFCLPAGDQVVYPFICSNLDEKVFPEPEALNVKRSDKEFEAILSWSKGPHECPAKELSILVAQVMLDKIAQEHDFAQLTILNPAF